MPCCGARINVTGAGLPDESNEFDGIDVLMDTKIHQNEFFSITQNSISQGKQMIYLAAIVVAVVVADAADVMFAWYSFSVASSLAYDVYPFAYWLLVVFVFSFSNSYKMVLDNFDHYNS